MVIQDKLVTDGWEEGGVCTHLSSRDTGRETLWWPKKVPCQSSEVHTGYLPQLLYTPPLFFQNRVSNWIWNLSIQLGWLISESYGFSCLNLFSTRITDAGHCIWLLYMGARDQTHVLTIKLSPWHPSFETGSCYVVETNGKLPMLGLQPTVLYFECRD